MRRYRGRFAPSPTGRLHFGSLISAVASYARARSQRGDWLLRMEDVDRAREVPGAADAIIADLDAYGMRSDEPVLRQSTRDGAYAAAVGDLLERQLAFHCACTRRDLPGDGRYPGTCEIGLPAGKPARSTRLRVPDAILVFHDRVQGRYEQQLMQELGAFVIHRADGYYAYQLAVVVDDAWQSITEVVRGCDLLDSTPRQIHLQRCLGLSVPDYLHHPVAVSADGQKLSKQLASAPVDAANPMGSLLAAWRFLNQSSPPPGPRRSVVAFWDWAIDAWDVDAVPAVQTIAVGDIQPGA